MKKILDPKEASTLISDLKNRGKKIVLAGGCFDILHSGHIKYLQNSKKQGDLLFVLLESDESIKRLKGKKRPINNQKDRSFILSSLKSVDFIVNLPLLKKDDDYDRLINLLKPDIIATTRGDTKRKDKERQAKLINARVIDVINFVPDKSTTNIEKLISEI